MRDNVFELSLSTNAHCHFLFKTIRKIKMKHGSAIISIKYNHRRALKDISEALEQLPSSKDISDPLNLSGRRGGTMSSHK